MILFNSDSLSLLLYDNKGSLLDEKYRIKNKKKRIEYETFINLLEKMPELKLD